MYEYRICTVFALLDLQVYVLTKYVLYRLKFRLMESFKVQPLKIPSVEITQHVNS